MFGEELIPGMEKIIQQLKKLSAENKCLKEQLNEKHYQLREYDGAILQKEVLLDFITGDCEDNRLVEAFIIHKYGEDIVRSETHIPIWEHLGLFETTLEKQDQDRVQDRVEAQVQNQPTLEQPRAVVSFE